MDLKLILFIIVLFIGFISLNNQDNTTDNNNFNEEELNIANWNLQIFGESKASNDNLLNNYADIISNYDIIFIQEIRDSSETAFKKLCDRLPDYYCTASSRAGRSTSKEQYGIIYKQGIQLLGLADFNPDTLDRWERPPIMAVFNVSNYIFTAYNIHTKPDDVLKELTFLQDVVSDSGNVVVLGDLNADCSYFNRNTNNLFSTYTWVISDNEDTTISKTDCAYDRILLNADMKQEYSGYGIYKNITSDMSDHYLVYVNIKP